MGALGMGVDTRELAAQAATNLPFFCSLSSVVDGRIALSAGGVVIRDLEHNVLGAVGVSGDTAEADETCAHAGIVAAGLHHGART